MKIIKRNGNEVEFDITKIENAIRKASAEVETQHQLSEDDVVYIARQVAKVCEEHNRAMNVEEIQDIVESKLIQYNYADVARCYIKYRFTRELVRKGNSTDESILAIIDNTNEEVKQENSNKNPTVNSVQRDYMAGEVSKDLTRRILLPPDIVRAHDAGIIHFHDADYFSQRMHNCFTGATKLITDKGVREFKSFNDGDHVVVKDKDGVLRDATVHLYGKQRMQVVTLTKGNDVVQFTCTPNHRWVLQDGTVTTSLAVNDVLYAPNDAEKWHVCGIVPNQGEADAWCVEEPITHTFTLEHGVVTGNCDLVNLEDMLQNGTVISGTLIEKPHSFSTACNIATQVIAQVASNQYGKAN